MNAKKPVAGVVSPFGIIGGRYEVDADGLKLYRISWIVVILAIALSVIGSFFDLSAAIRYGILAVGFVVSLALCTTVVRNGTKL